MPATAKKRRVKKKPKSESAELTHEERLIEQIAVQKEITRRDCRESFYNFFQYFWPAIIPEPLVDNWHIKYLCYELQELSKYIIAREPSPYDLVINIPPGTTKSTIVTIMFPAWLWLVDPTLRVISGSYSADIAIDHAVRSRQILKSYRFEELYGNEIQFSDDQDNKSYYANTAGGTRAACGTCGGVTGKHAHVIIIDDPINPKQSDSEVYRKGAIDWIKKTLSTRKIDKAGTPMIFIMQRLHEDDPSGHRLTKPGARHICLPAEITDLKNVSPEELEDFYVGGLLDPVRMPKDVLEKEREMMGSVAYAGQYLQSPSAAEGNLFKREWFKRYDTLPAGLPLRIVNSWDTAITKNETSHYSACTTWMEYPNGFYLANYYQAKLEYPELKREIYNRSITFRAHYNLIENKSSGQAIIQEFAIEGKLTIVAVEVDRDKVARAKTASPTCEAGKVFLPSDPSINILLDQLCGFPNTKYDDGVDSVTQFLNWARENPFETPIAVGRGVRESDKILRGFKYGKI